MTDPLLGMTSLVGTVPLSPVTVALRLTMALVFVPAEEQQLTRVRQLLVRVPFSRAAPAVTSSEQVGCTDKHLW
jgi:hypothetical protein